MGLDGGDGGGDRAGPRATMERKRIVNARQTAMRQRKFERLAKQQEEEEKRRMKEVLQRRKRERARLSAYLHPINQKQQIRHTSTSAKTKPSKPCIVQNPDFAARLRESIKAAAHDSFLSNETRQLFFRMATHVPVSAELNWDQSRLIGSFDEETDNSLKKCAAKNLRVTFHPAADSKEDRAQLLGEKFGHLREGDATRPLSPTIVLDGPDPDSSSNSSFLAQNTAEPLSKPERMFSTPQAEQRKTALDDLNAFLEEALKLRLDSENATNRMIAEVTGLDSRLDDVQSMTMETEDSLKCRDDQDGTITFPTMKDEANRCMTVKDMLDVETSQDMVQYSLDSVCSRDDKESQRMMPARDCKVYRSEAWEVGFSDCDNNSDQCSVPSKDPEPTSRNESSRLPPLDVASARQCSTDGSSRCLGMNRAHLSSGLKSSCRLPDLAALSREESNVLASLERLDWKLTSAMARCRDSGLSDGYYSVQSAPTVISHGNGTARSNNARRYDSARAQTSHSLKRFRKRQNVGLTNKRQDGRFPSSESQPRVESFPQIVDRTIEPRCAPSNGREGVIVFHPDSYCMLNPVSSP